jgi:hypothetical protein
MEETTDTKVYEFDIDKMPTTKKIISLHQEGNYLVGITELGTHFRKHIPVGKELTKEGDTFVLKNRVVT